MILSDRLKSFQAIPQGSSIKGSCHGEQLNRWFPFNYVQPARYWKCLGTSRLGWPWTSKIKKIMIVLSLIHLCLHSSIHSKIEELSIKYLLHSRHRKKCLYKKSPVPIWMSYTLSWQKINHKQSWRLCLLERVLSMEKCHLGWSGWWVLRVGSLMDVSSHKGLDSKTTSSSFF